MDDIEASRILAAASFAGAAASIVLLMRRSRLAPLSMISTGVVAFYFFVSNPIFLMSGLVVSLLLAEIGLLSFVLEAPDYQPAQRRKRNPPSVVRIKPPTYYLSDSGVWRLHRPVEYLSESGVWRRKGQSRTMPA